MNSLYYKKYHAIIAMIPFSLPHYILKFERRAGNRRLWLRNSKDGSSATLSGSG